MEDFGKYKIKKQIGIGGTASVYLAEHTGLDRDVILKVMSDTLFSHEIDYIKLFVEEAQIIAKLNHPNIVQVYDISISEERTFIEMEFLSGGTLKERFNNNQDYVPLKVINEIASALQYVFKTTGTIHRDIKPSNILFREEELGLVAVLSDFGIAKTEDTDTEFTNIGVRVGTPRYMSPEQLMGRPVDQRSDLYSLGIILYEMLNGELFNREDNPDATTNFKIPKLAAEHKKLQPIINKLTSTNPDSRYKNGDELIEALAKFKNYKPLKAKKDSKLREDVSSVLTRTLSKIKSHKLTKPKKKSHLIIYFFAFIVNALGGFYYYSESIKNENKKNEDIEALEVSLLRFQQNEINIRDINESFQIVSNNYPNEVRLEKINNKIKNISNINQLKTHIDNANILVDNKQYSLANKELMLAMKIAPSKKHISEIDLIKELVKKKKAEEKANELSELNKLKHEEEINSYVNTEVTKVTGKPRKYEFVITPDSAEKTETSKKQKEKKKPTKAKNNCHHHLADNKGNLVSHCHPFVNKSHVHNKLKIKQKEKKKSRKKKPTKAKNNCHHHLADNKGNLVSHCHPFVNKSHVHNKAHVHKKPKINSWTHNHKAILNCSKAIRHTHRYKNKNHRHKYNCKNKNLNKWRHHHKAIPNCSGAITHTHKFTQKGHNHRYQCKKIFKF